MYEYPTTLAEAEELDRAPRAEKLDHAPRVVTPAKPDKRGKSKHWATHTFRATFVQFLTRYDPRTMKRCRTVQLRDVYMDGELLTLNWTVDCPAKLQALCPEPGEDFKFTAEFTRTAHESTRLNAPLLRPPFRPAKEIQTVGQDSQTVGYPCLHW